MATATEQELHDRVTQLVYGFFNTDEDAYEKIRNTIQDGKSRLVLTVHDFDRIDQELAQRLLTDPFTYLPPCEEALKQILQNLLKISRELPPAVGFTGWLGSHSVTPRGLTARLVNRLICVEGIVTRCSLVKPKLLRSVHFAEGSGRHLVRTHQYLTMVSKDRSLQTAVPKTDQDGNYFQLEPGLSLYQDTQRATIQEMPEMAPTGQLPRSIDVVLNDDLVDQMKPGDRVRLYGVFRGVAGREGSKVPGYGRSFIVSNNVEQLQQHVLTPDIGPTEMRVIRDIAQRRDTFSVLARSVCPALYGRDWIKRGLLLQLFGGERKLLEDDSMKLRGDIHVLLIGDPSCGKSQMLRFMMNTCPLAISTTGRGSSGVGLTAAVTSDKDSGERRLEAGAMVLADGGMVCIDEFDKMSSEDRVAIHEVMEQQTVTISKASIQSTLNARCCVLAAANPVYGTVDDQVDLKSQIAFPDSLLSRFDLIFVVRDSRTTDEDRRICQKVLAQRGRRPEETGLVLATNAPGAVEELSAAYIIQPRMPENPSSDPNKMWITPVNAEENNKKYLSVDFLRKYVFYARSRPAPGLTDEAVERIANFYADLRARFVTTGTEKDGQLTKRSQLSIPTPRTLEACIRLATAHAKLKLRDGVIEDDVIIAEKLLLYTLCGELPQDDEEEEEEEEVQKTRAPRRRKGSAGQKRPLSSGIETVVDSMQAMTVSGGKKSKQNETSSTAQPKSSPDSITSSRLRELTRLVGTIQQDSQEDSVQVEDLLGKVNALATRNYSAKEFDAGMAKLQVQNKIMLVDSTVWFV